MYMYSIAFDGIPFQNKWIILDPGCSLVYSGLSPTWSISSLRATGADEGLSVYAVLLVLWQRWAYLNNSLILGTFQTVILFVSVFIGRESLKGLWQHYYHARIWDSSPNWSHFDLRHWLQRLQPLCILLKRGKWRLQPLCILLKRGKWRLNLYAYF